VSIVVWDGNSLAVDRSCTDGVTVWEVDKLWEFNGEAITGVGDMAALTLMRDWYMAGAMRAEFRPVPSRTTLIVVNVDKGLVKYEASPDRVEHGRNKCAFGTGRAYAMGAMAMGATARQAAIVAAEFDPHCSTKLDMFP